MFVEPNLQNIQRNSGWIEVIAGCMFSGKTEELIRRINRAKIAKQSVQIFKPSIEERYHSKHVVSHDANAIYSIPVKDSQELWDLAEDVDVIGIDELQFFDKDIVGVCVRLANRGARVIATGLDMDYKAKPFGSMPQIMAVAEFVTKVHAICMQCGSIANYSFRKTTSKKQVLLGETETYEARCRKCFYEQVLEIDEV